MTNESNYYALKYGPKRYALPRVTHVIGSTLARPALQQWYYRQTLDSIAGLVDMVVGLHEDQFDVLLELLRDSENLDEWLTELKMRPVDVRDEAGAEGTEKHAILEALAKTALLSDHVAADVLAAQLWRESDEGHAHAIADWWMTRQPEVVASELTVASWIDGYAGTIDLVWRDGDVLTITDLKNRKENGEAWESDGVQVGAYEAAYTEETGQVVDETTVLVARADGTWVEEVFEYGPDPFRHLLATWRLLRGEAYRSPVGHGPEDDEVREAKAVPA